MNKHSFSEDDKTKVIEYLNYIAQNAKFDGITVKQNIEFFKLLQFMQQVLLPKIEAHILEIKKVHEAKPEESKE